MQTNSEILANGVNFELRRMAQKFLKAREAVVKCSHASALEDMKANAKQARINLEWFMATTGQDFDADAIIEDFVGFGRVWNATDAMIEKVANEQGISNEQAREVLTVSMTQAQAYAQTTRGNLVGIYGGWLSDLDPDNGGIPDEATHYQLHEVVKNAYAKAAEWLRRDEGLLIEASAEDWGILLPTWASQLPKITEAVQTMRRKMENKVQQRAEYLRDQYMSAAAEINPSDW